MRKYVVYFKVEVDNEEETGAYEISAINLDRALQLAIYDIAQEYPGCNYIIQDVTDKEGNSVW